MKTYENGMSKLMELLGTATVIAWSLFLGPVGAVLIFSTRAPLSQTSLWLQSLAPWWRLCRSCLVCLVPCGLCRPYMFGDWQIGDRAVSVHGPVKDAVPLP